MSRFLPCAIRVSAFVGALVFGGVLVAGGLGVGMAQPAPARVRLALLPQWTINQHRAAVSPVGGRVLAPELRTAVESGVTDGVVFWWRRGAIERRSLVPKPIRVLPPAEAAPLGARGTFQLVNVVPPSATAAWTTVEVAPQSGQPGDVLVLEVGGELNTITQVLETLLVLTPARGLEELPLARRALIPASGVPVVKVPFGRPVALADGVPVPRGAEGIEFLVARSQVDVVTDGDTTPNGAADRATTHVGDWREGDRVFVRLPLATLRAGAPAIVLGWKDRTPKPDPGDRPDIRQSRLPGLLFR